VTAFVQSGSDTSGTAAFGRNTTVGNCLIACVQAYGASSVGAVTTGSSHDNWTALKTVSGGGQVAAIWIDPACTVSKSTVTFTASGASMLNIQAYEFSGMGNAPVLDVIASHLQTTTGTTAWSSGATPSAAAADLRIAMFGGNDGSSSYSTAPPASPWLLPEGITRQTGAGNESVVLVSGYFIPGTTGTVTFNSTTGTSASTWAAIAAGVLPGSTGGGSSAGSFLPFFT
jgi:hypothetical protein